MKVKDLIKTCSTKDLIIIRDQKAKIETKAPNIEPYKKVFAYLADRKILDNFRDGENCLIILI